MNDVSIIIQFNGREITIPINPENISIKESANNSNLEILGVGKAVRKVNPNLITTKISSFFPSVNSPFYDREKHCTPYDYIKFINDIWHAENINNNVARIITQGLDTNLNMLFVIDNFDYDYKAGDDDTAYSLSIKQYIEYGVTLVDTQLTGMATARAQATTASAIETATSSSKTYTVQSGDSLFTITKRCTGNGSQWGALYELNKDKIKNPSLIYPGQILILPNDWSAPIATKPVIKVVSSNNSSKKSNVSQEVIDRHSAAFRNHTEVAPITTTAEVGQPYYWRTTRR